MSQWGSSNDYSWRGSSEKEKTSETSRWPDLESPFLRLTSGDGRLYSEPEATLAEQFIEELVTDTLGTPSKICTRSRHVARVWRLGRGGAHTCNRSTCPPPPPPVATSLTRRKHRLNSGNSGSLPSGRNSDRRLALRVPQEQCTRRPSSHSYKHRQTSQV